MSNPAEKLRELIARRKMVVTPGCYDALSARMIEQAGFDAAYMTGFGTSASVLGMPDAGLISFTEMLNHATNIANAISIPLIADGDTGYGNALNTFRTVKAYARAGIAGIHIEDQVFPKKCGHVSGKKIIPLEEMAGKIRAAADARTEQDIVVIARTDARAVAGPEEAMRRAKAFVEAGADMIFYEAPESLAEITAVAENVDAPLLINMALGGKTPFMPISKLEELGFRIAIYPIFLMKSSIEAMHVALERLKNDPDTDPTQGQYSFEDIKRLLGFPEYYEMEEKYSS